MKNEAASFLVTTTTLNFFEQKKVFFISWRVQLPQDGNGTPLCGYFQHTTMDDVTSLEFARLQNTFVTLAF